MMLDQTQGGDYPASDQGVNLVGTDQGGSGTMRFLVVSTAFLLASTLAYVTAHAGYNVPACLLAGVALAALGYGAVLFYDWRVDRRLILQARLDGLRIERERHYADMLAADGEVYVDRLDAETRRLQALKIESDGRETLILDGVVIGAGAGAISARLNHPTPVALPANYQPRIQISYPATAPGPALVTPASLPTLAQGGLDLVNLTNLLDTDNGRVMLAIDSSGAPIYTRAVDLCHVGIAGATGGGKSSIMRLLLAQLLASGCNVLLADPHYTALDADSGDDWRPIADKLAAPPAFTTEDMTNLLTWLATDELPRRLELRRRGEKVGKPIFLALDELPALVKRVPTAPDFLGEILREGRKVGIMLICSAQDFLVKTIGGDSAVRDCYRTAYYTGGDETSARVLLDVRASKGAALDDGTLGKGAVMLRAATTSAVKARVPYTSNAALYQMLGATALAAPGPAPASDQGAAIAREGLAVVDNGQVVNLATWRERSASRAPREQGITDQGTPRAGHPPARLSDEQSKVLAAYQAGHTSARKIQDATGADKNRVPAILDGLRLAGLITGEVI